MKQLLDPAYRDLCSAIMSRDCKKLLEYLYQCEYLNKQPSILECPVDNPVGCLALLACLGFITQR